MASNPLSNARQWWQNRAQERQEARQQAAFEQASAQIPVLDLRNAEGGVLPVQYPTAKVLGLEDEARLADGVPDIPLDFQTRTINPERPRTVGAGYDPATQTLRLKFRPGASKASPGGAVYDYFDVSEKEWMGVQRAISTGIYLNRQLADKEYARRA